MNKRITDTLKIFAISIFIILSYSLVESLFKLNMIPVKFLYPIFIVIFLLNILLLFFLLHKKKKKEIFAAIGYGIFSIIIFIGIQVTSTANTFLDAFFNNHTEEISTYQVVVLKESKIDVLTDLTNKKLGYLRTDSTIDKALSTLDEKVTTKQESEADLYTLYNRLIDKQLDVILIDSSYLDMLAEKFPDIFEKTRTIHQFDIKTPIAKKKTKIDQLEPITIFVSGSDSRTANIALKSRSDVNMIITINPNTRTILLTSIPRDYFVPLHGMSGEKEKLSNSGVYGLEMTVKTVEDLFDMTIDYSVKISMEAVVQLVDEIGGITIENEQEFDSSHFPNWHVPKGTIQLDGEHALAYSRERYAYKEGDRHRILNQQVVLTAVLKKIMTSETLLNHHEQLLTLLQDFYRTDIPKEIIQLFVKMQLDNPKEWKIETQSVDGKGDYQTTYTFFYTKVYVMIPYEEDVKKASKKIEEVLSA